MTKATWLLLVSIFADLCILVYSNTSEMPKYFKDLEFEELKSGYTPKISETYTEPTPPNGLTTTPKNFCTVPNGPEDSTVHYILEHRENPDAESVHPELGGLRYGGDEMENRDAESVHPELGGLRYGGDEMKSSELDPRPAEGETMKDTGLSPGSDDEGVPIPWQFDQGHDLGQSDQVGGQMSNADPGFGQGLSIDGAPPIFDQSGGQILDIDRTTRAPQSSGLWAARNMYQAVKGVQNPDADQGSGINDNTEESDRDGDWVSEDSGISAGRNLVAISNLGMIQGPTWRPSLNMRSNVGLHSGPTKDLGQNGPLSGSGGPPQPGGHKSQDSTSGPNVPGEHRRSLVHGTEYGFYDVNARRNREDFRIHPTRKPGSRLKQRKDERLFKPGHDEEESKEMDEPDIHQVKFLPTPTTKNPFLGYDQSIREEQIPQYSGGKLPGPGSESLYPNGYRIDYNALMNTAMRSRGGSGQYQMGQQQRGGYPKAGQMPPRQVQGNPGALRQGAPSMDDYYFGANPANPNTALQMGNPSLGVQPGMAGGNMVRGPPAGYNPGQLPFGPGRAPAPGGQPMVRSPGMKEAFVQAFGNVALPQMGGGPPAGYRAEPLPGIGEGALPQYMQRGGGPEMDGLL